MTNNIDNIETDWHGANSFSASIKAVAVKELHNASVEILRSLAKFFVLFHDPTPDTKEFTIRAIVLTCDPLGKVWSALRDTIAGCSIYDLLDDRATLKPAVEYRAKKHASAIIAVTADLLAEIRGGDGTWEELRAKRSELDTVIGEIECVVARVSQGCPAQQKV